MLSAYTLRVTWLATPRLSHQAANNDHVLVSGWWGVRRAAAAWLHAPRKIQLICTVVTLLAMSYKHYNCCHVAGPEGSSLTGRSTKGATALNAVLAGATYGNNLKAHTFSASMAMPCHNTSS
jgi:hypothetical protein